MIKNTFDIEMNSVLDADICIIGAGCAGITLAKEFINTPYKVLLLESGGFEYDDKTQSLYEGENISFNPFKLENTRLRYFGGATNHWGGTCRPFDRIDFEARSGTPYSGWPISLADLRPFYLRAQTVCQLGEFIYDDEDYWRKVIDYKPLPLKSDLIKTSFFQLSPPTRFGTEYREVLAKADNIDVLLNANVQELELAANLRNITSVRIKNLTGSSIQARAKVFILATGGLEVPRLLLLSNSKLSKGVGNEYDQVGRYYMDHLTVWGGTIQFAAGKSVDSVFFMEKKSPTNTIGAFLSPTEKFIKQQNTGNFRIRFSPASHDLGLDSLHAIKESVASGKIPEDISSHIKNIIVNFDSVSNVVLKNAFNTKNDFFNVNHSAVSDRTYCNFELNLEQSPNKNSRVTLSNDKDFFGQNRIKLDWQLSDADSHTATKAYELLSTEAGKYALGRVRITNDLLEGKISPLISSHHMGTTRMSLSPTDGVVNTNCRLHGIDNLYVSSSAVFPVSGWANPTLTITALAIRLADYLKSNLG